MAMAIKAYSSPGYYHPAIKKYKKQKKCPLVETDLV
jgi:hypothetical protein